MGRRRSWYRNTVPYEQVAEIKSNLTEAFKILRKEGYIARQNFYCCSGCAGSAIAGKVTEMPASKVARIKGCVFYHNQGNSRLMATGEVYLAYGSVESTKHGTVGLPTVEVGKRVVEVLKTVGLTVEWDGDENTGILVK